MTEGLQLAHHISLHMTDLCYQAKFAEEAPCLVLILPFKQGITPLDFLDGEVFPVLQETFAKGLVVLSGNPAESIVDKGLLATRRSHRLKHSDFQSLLASLSGLA